jgi:O-antigen/teichoic acid export membrane protein
MQINNKLQNLMILTNNNALAAGMSYMFTLYIANKFGPEIYGQYSYILAWAGLFGIFVQYSFNEAAPAYYSRGDRLQTLFNDIFTIRVILLIVLLAIMVVRMLFSKSPLTNIMVVGYTVPNLAISFMYEIYDKRKKYSFIYLVERSVYIILVIMYGFVNEITIVTLFLAFTIVSILSIVFQYHQYSHYIKSYRYPKMSDLILRMKDNLPLVSIELSNYAYGGISKIMIEDKLGAFSLGLFSTGMQLLLIMNIFQAQVNNLWRIPLFKSINERNARGFISVVIEYIKYSTLPAIVLTILFYLYSPDLIHYLFSSEYEPLTNYVQLIGFFIILINVNSLISMLWIGFDKKNTYMIISIIFAAILGLTLWFSSSDMGLVGYIKQILIIRVCHSSVSLILLYHWNLKWIQK